MDALDAAHLSDLIHRLSDVELAVLLCLVAEQHCFLTADEPYLDHVSRHVELIASDGFGLPAAMVHCTADMTLDQFANGLLVDNDAPVPTLRNASTGQDNSDSYSPFRRAHRVRSASQSTVDPFAGHRIASVIVARDLHLASEQVQIQALELMRTKRLTTKKSAVDAPDMFLFVALLPKTALCPTLLASLLDHFFISHHHAADEDDAIFESGNMPIDGHEQQQPRSDADSLSSVVVRKPVPRTFTAPYTLVPQALVASIRALVHDVTINTEVNRYLIDTVVFLRMHRAVAAGVTPKATKDFQLLVRCLAALHALDFATPALVGLAIFKIYTHRLNLVRVAADERSFLWGGSETAVAEYLKGMDVESVIEDVLSSVSPPV